MSLQQKVSSAIRILRWNRDVSARASHLVEVIHNFQAESENVSDSTVFFERKLMSTKTSIKRIAAVAAVALTLGGFSAVSAHATAPTLSGTVVVAGTSTKATAVVGSYVAESITAGTSDSYYTITSSGVGTVLYPAATSAGLNSSTLTTQSASTSIWSDGQGVIGGVSHATPVAWTNTVLNFSVNSAVAGTQVITVTGSSSAAQTLTITWGAAQTYSAGLSTAILNNVAHGVSATSDDTISIDKGTAPSTYNAAGTIAVSLVGSDSLSYNNGSVSAVVSGPALINVDNTAAVQTANTGAFGYGNTVTAPAGAAYVHIESAGIAGVATITVSVTDANAVTTVLATKTVTFTGALSAIKAVGNLSVLKAGGLPYASNVTAGGALTVANTIPVSAFITDASGNKVASANNSYVIKAVSSDSTILTGGTCVPAIASVALASGFTTASTAITTGEYNCPVSGTALAASGAKATITVTAYKADGTTVVASAAPVTFAIGGEVAKVALSTDATSYVVGAPVSLIATATDSAGNAAYDQDYTLFSTGATSSTVLGSAALPAADTAYTLVGGIHTFTGSFAPVFGTSVTIKAVDNLTALNALSTSFDVTSPANDASQAAIDAAQEATDAANAAYDAANNAMDSADAATAAAQDASDNASAALAAVTSLSATVAKLVSSVTAIATALAAIKKKLGVK